MRLDPEQMLCYAALGLIGALPVFFLVASSRCQNLYAARQSTMEFLKDWAGIAPKALREWIRTRTAIGSSFGFAFLMALAVSFNFVGDHSMPVIARSFGYFGSPEVEWSEEHKPQWKQFKADLRDRWTIVHREDMNNPVVFEGFKNDHGKESVRASRTLVIFSLLLIAAGLLDLRSKRFRRRGLGLLSIGFFSFFLFSIVWVNRKEHYIYEVIIANQSLGKAKVAIPASWNGPLPRTAQKDT